MIKDFLQNCRDELLEEKFDLEKSIEQLNISMLEEKKFLEAIESDSDSIFNEFSPRDLNAKNKAREEEVIKKIGTIQAELNNNNDKLNKINNKLKEISELLLEVNNEKEIVNPSIEESVIEENISSTSYSYMIPKLVEIKNMIYLDQASAEKEINILINSLKSTEN